MIKITPDKWKHFFVGLLMGLVIYLFVYYLFHLRTTTIIAVTMGIVVTVSYVFELISRVTGKGHYEIMDAVAGIVGGALAVGILLLILH